MNLLRDSKEDIIKLMFREAIACPDGYSVPIVLSKNGDLIVCSPTTSQQTLTTRRFTLYVKSSSIFDWTEELEEHIDEEGNIDGYIFTEYPEEILSYDTVIDIIADDLVTDDYNELIQLYELFHSEMESYLTCHRCHRSVLEIEHETFNIKGELLYICKECVATVLLYAILDEDRRIDLECKQQIKY